MSSRYPERADKVRSCRFCGSGIVWGTTGLRWVPIDPGDGSRHHCLEYEQYRRAQVPQLDRELTRAEEIIDLARCYGADLVMTDDESRLRLLGRPLPGVLTKLVNENLPGLREILTTRGRIAGPRNLPDAESVLVEAERIVAGP